jgi:hypothetical protein
VGQNLPQDFRIVKPGQAKGRAYANSKQELQEITGRADRLRRCLGRPEPMIGIWKGAGAHALDRHFAASMSELNGANTGDYLIECERLAIQSAESRAPVAFAVSLVSREFIFQ